MEVVIRSTARETAGLAADAVARLLGRRRDAVLGLVWLLAGVRPGGPGREDPDRLPAALGW